MKNISKFSFFLFFFALVGCGGTSNVSSSVKEIPKAVVTETEQYTLTEEYRKSETTFRTIFTCTYKPKVEQKKYRTVIMSHGYRSSFDGLRLDANALAKQNYVVIGFDFCGGGPFSKSDLKFDDMTLDTEQEDLNDILNYALSLSFVDQDNIFLYGASQGGLISTLVGAQHQDKVKGLCLEYPAYTIGKNATSGDSLSKSSKYIEVAKTYVDKIDPAIESFKKEVLIIHGDKDALVPLSSSQHAVDLFENATLVVAENGEHGFNTSVYDNGKYWHYVLEFLAK